MKKMFMLLFCLQMAAICLSQGITLLYKGNGGWNDPAGWIQLNAPAGQTPIQRVPTEADDVVFSKTLSGMERAGFGFGIEDSLEIGGTKNIGYRCRSMHISNMDVAFTTQSDYALSLHVYTGKGGQLRIDSGGNMSRGRLLLHGGNKAIYDLEIMDSKYGDLFTHAVWSSITLLPKGRAKLVNSNCEGWEFGSYPTGGEFYAENCTFKTPSFVLGDNSKASLLDCSISDGNNFVTLSFGIGRGSDFTSRNVELKALTNLAFYTSGSVLNGNLTTEAPQGGLRLQQKDPANPLHNIINGNLKIFGQGLDLSGGLKLSGNLINFAVDQDMYPDSSHVYINGQSILKIGGIANYGSDVSTNNCRQAGCHFKLEFFGDKNSQVVWPVGFPADTLIINKSNCAKVSFQNPLYVSGETRIQNGQLTLDPNEGILYKFICTGDLKIAKGGGLFLRKNSKGEVANMAVSGTISDQNTSADTSCQGFSNPYHGVVLNTNFAGVTLLYKGGSSGGWDDPSNWIQINTPAGKAPLQRVPMEMDAVVFSKSMSGLSTAEFIFPDADLLLVGGTWIASPLRCRNLHISGMEVRFTNPTRNFTVHVYTSYRGFVLLDSAAIFRNADFQLHGGTSTVLDLQVENSRFGPLRSADHWNSILLHSAGLAKFSNSTLAGWNFGSFADGGSLYAENSRFITSNFSMGNYSRAYLEKTSFETDAAVPALNFHLDHRSNLSSSEVLLQPHSHLDIYTSGAVLKGNINVLLPSANAINFSQQDSLNPRPNIIDGNISFVSGSTAISGSLALSGNLSNKAAAADLGALVSTVKINQQPIFNIGGIANFGNCTQQYCHFKLEFFGDKNSSILWPSGFPVDTLVITKTGCAKLSLANPLYVSGETRIQSGQLVITPVHSAPYQFVCAGDVNIAGGGGLLLRKNSPDLAAGMAIGGSLTDENSTVDSTCAGLANPYNGTIALYQGLQNQDAKPIAITAPTNIGDLTLLGTAGTDFYLGKELTVNNFTFTTPAKVFLGNHNLVINGAISNYGPANYFVTDGLGKLQINKVGSSERVFPVGASTTSYNPLFLTNAGTPDDFRVLVQPTVLTGGSSGTALSEKVVNRTWHIEEQTPGGSNATVKLQWNAADEANSFARTTAYLSHFTAGNWDNSTPVPATGTGPFSLSRSSLTSFSPFAVFSSILNSVTAPSDRLVLAFPNPVRDHLQIQLPARFLPITIQIVDNKGTLVKTLQVKAGTTVVPVNTSGLPAGRYLAVLSSGNWKETLPFVKQ